MHDLGLGGVFTSLDTLGPAPRSNWTGRPQPGNDFHTRYAEDLNLLAEIGVMAIRLGFDWARLQPSPGAIDHDWREWYEHVLDAAARAGIGVWATLHERTVPAWFDDDGSFAEAKTTGRWWPRWVEWCADRFGDRVAGWYPIHDPVGAAERWTDDPRRHEAALVGVATAWRDAWRILGGGGPPVAASLAVRMPRAADHTVPAAQAARLEDALRWRVWMRAWRDGVVHLPNGVEREVADLRGSLDVVGVATTLDLPEGAVSDESLRRWEERLGSVVRRAAEEGPERPLVVSGLEIAWPNDEERRLLVEASGRAVTVARADGVQLQTVFVTPAIPGAHLRHVAGIVDRDRNHTAITPVWQSLVTR